MGSMDAIKNDAIGGFNSFLAEQKKIDRKANVTFVLFDDRYQLVHDGKDINEVEKLDDNTYQPSGTTALLDAVGRTVDRVGERLPAPICLPHPCKDIVHRLLTVVRHSNVRLCDTTMSR